MPQSNLDLILRTRNEGTGAQQAAEDLQTAETGLTNFEKAAAGTRTTIAGLDTDLQLFGTNIGSVSDLMSGMGLKLPVTPMQALGQVTSATVDFLKGAVDTTQEYTFEIEDLSRNLGISADEASRLYNVGDDLRVSFDVLKTAAKALASEGIVPNIDTLARLSDEYLAIEGAGAKAQWATDKFGKSAQEITKILEQGGGVIRQMAEGVEGGLIISDENIANAKEFYTISDDLGDVWQAFTLTVGNMLIPYLTDLLELAKWAVDLLNKANYGEIAQEAGNAWVTAFAEIDATSSSAIEAVQKFGVVAAENGKILTDNMVAGVYMFVRENEKFLTTAGMSKDVLAKLNEMLINTSRSYEDYSVAVDAAVEKGYAIDKASEAAYEALLFMRDVNLLNTQATDDATVATDGSTAALWGYVNAAEAVNGVTGTLTKQGTDLAAGFTVIDAKFKDYQAGLNGQFGPAVEDFTEKQGKLRDRAAEVLKEIERLKGIGYTEQSKEVQGLRTEYGDLQTGISDAAAEHRQKMQEMVLDLLIQRAAVDGLTADEYTLITTLGNAWGIVDDDTMTAMQGADAALTALANGEGMEAALQAAQTLVNTVDGLEGDYLINFHISTSGSFPEIPNPASGEPPESGLWTPPPETGTPGAGGGGTVGGGGGLGQQDIAYPGAGQGGGVTVMPGAIVIQAAPGMDIVALAELVAQYLGVAVRDAQAAGAKSAARRG